jgi:pumilio family protein 6
LVATILKEAEGRIAELAGLHNASRIVQSCLKHGTEEHRKQVIAELKPKLLYLAQNQYGHFLVKKILHYSKAELPFMLTSFRGKFVALLRHPCGSSVVDDMYHLANRRQKDQMASEFYGPEVALLANLATDELSLSNVLEKATSAQRAAILTHVYMKLTPILDKGLVDAHLVHFVIREFFQFAAPGAIQEAAQNLAGPHLLHLVHTREGSAAAVNVICASNPKGRKKIVKALKGRVAQCAIEEHGHIALLCLFAIVDDTVLVDKNVTKEMIQSLKDICLNKFGKRIILRLLNPAKVDYIPENIQKLLKPEDRIVKASNLKLPSLEDSDEELENLEEEEEAEEEEEEEQEVCKKPLEVKCKELLFGSSKLAQKLVKLCTEESMELICSPHGSEIVMEVVRRSENNDFEDKVSAEEIDAFFGSLVTLVAEASEAMGGSSSASEEEEKEENKEKKKGGDSSSVLENFYGSRTLQKLVSFSCKEGKSTFAKKLWEGAAEQYSSKWVGSHAEKVLRAYTECPTKKISNKAKKLLASK